MTEDLFYKKIVKPRLNSLEKSWWYRCPTRVIRGIPDVIGVYRGRFIALELKKSKAKKDKSRETLQKFIICKIQDSGGIAIFGVNPENFEEIFLRLNAL